MRSFEIGIVLPIMQYGPDRATTRWPDLRAMAVRAEEIGFDTIWTPDELLWRMEDGPPRGVWEGISMAGAVAAVTSRTKVGTWVMSALHRNPGIIAKAAETLDEISGGRFVFGLGAGHEWPGQAHAFGLPETGSSPGSRRRCRSSSRCCAGSRPEVISGSPEDIADAFRSFRDAGFTQLEIMFSPGTMAALESLAAVLNVLDADSESASTAAGVPN